MLTSSPYKKYLKDFYTDKDQNNSNQASTSGTSQKMNPAANKKKKVKRRKRKISSSSDTEDSKEPPLVDNDYDSDVDSDDPDSTDATCTFCKEKYQMISVGISGLCPLRASSGITNFVIQQVATGENAHVRTVLMTEIFNSDLTYNQISLR